MSSGSVCAAPTSSSSPARWPTCTRATRSYPMRIGHEWAGRVAAVGDGVDPAWIGRRVMGDTMLGCGICRRCRRGHQHVCEHRQEVGIRGGRPGALAEQLAVPASSLHALPDSVGPALGALVEPGGNALRAAQAAELRPGDRALVLGPGHHRAAGRDVRPRRRCGGASDGPHRRVARLRPLAGLRTRLDRGLRAGPAVRRGDRRLQRRRSCPPWPWSWSSRPVASSTSDWPVSRAGSTPAPSPSRTSRRSASCPPPPASTPRSAPTPTGRVDPRPLVAATVGLDQVGAVLAGDRPADAGPGPKIHVDPRLT